MVILLVAGLTAMAVMLAHFAGHFARDLAAGHGSVARLVLKLCVGAWALLGIGAVVVRALVDPAEPGPLDASEFNAGTGTSSPYVAALLFAALYVASGMVAGIGAFVTRNPLRADYRRTRKAYRKTRLKLRKSEPPYERAKHVYELHRTGLRRDEENYDAARQQRLAYAEELKRFSAARIAAHLQSPSATDGMTEEDWRPMNPKRPASPADLDQPPSPPSPPPPVPPGTPLLPTQFSRSSHNHADGS
jgi:hypothetical protein